MSRRKKRKQHGNNPSASEPFGVSGHPIATSAALGPLSPANSGSKTGEVPATRKVLALSLLDDEPRAKSVRLPPISLLKAESHEQIATRKKNALSLFDDEPNKKIPRPSNERPINWRPFSENLWTPEIVSQYFTEAEIEERNRDLEGAIACCKKDALKQLKFEGPSFVKGRIIVKELAERLEIKPFKIIGDLIGFKVFTTADRAIELDAVSHILTKHGFSCRLLNDILVFAPPGAALVPATRVPPEITQCYQLEEVSLVRNCIAELPRGIEFLSTLKILNLEGAGICALPAGFRDCSTLTHLYLHNNPALDLPPEILGPTAREVVSLGLISTAPRVLIDYYEARLLGGRPLNEIKLLLLGRGECGKTSVSRRLRENQFLEGQTETPGIDIRRWITRYENNDVMVHMWDFAGQEITHETHRYFLTERSIYLIVLDGRGGQQMEEAEYWLQHVERFGTRNDGDHQERSPVIVVLNKWKSPGPYEVERRRIQREYPNVRAFVEVDCKSGFGIEELRNEIRHILNHMPAVQQMWPLSYFKVREILTELAAKPKREERRPFLTWSAFKGVCVSCGVSDSDQQESLADSLNSLGMALYYGSDVRLRDTRVLNPNWAANGLYGLLRGVQRMPFEGKQGVLWTGDLTSILKEGLTDMDGDRGASIDDYPKETHGVNVHTFLVELMQDREMGFLAGEHNGHALFLLPSLLPIDEPPLDQFNIAAHIDGSELRFRFLYELLPAGIMSRFIVRTHLLSESAFRWQRGVVLEWEGSIALVIAERRRNPRIDIHLRGGTENTRQQLAGIIRMNIREIERTLPGGFGSKEELDLTIPGDQYESVDKLLRLEFENQPVQVMTDEGAVQIPVTPELEQLQPATARRNAKHLKVFVSYAHANYSMLGHLRTHLDVLLNEQMIQWWYDGKIRPGSEWDGRIRKELGDADVIIFLISNAFFASRYINGVELFEARRRAEAGDVRVLPVLLEETPSFGHHEWLSTLQALPVQNGVLRPMNSYRHQVKGWNLVQHALRSIADEINGSTPIAASPGAG